MMMDEDDTSSVKHSPSFLMMNEDNTSNALNHGVQNLSIPPGFMSHKSFRLRRVEKTENYNLKTSQDATKTKQTQIVTLSGTSGNEMMDATYRQRPWVLFDQSNDNSLDFDSLENDMNLPGPTQSCLPIGVTHGCPDCSDCLKVTARWQPEIARTDVLEEAPVFYPTEEEFSDTLHYIERIRPRTESYGICRIVPPPSWLPPCLLKEKEIWENSTFLTCNERIDGLQKNSYGELLKCSGNIESKRRRLSMGLEFECGNRSFRNYDGSCAFDKEGLNSQHGREFTLKTFKSYADDFKFQYFSGGNKVTTSESNSCMSQEQWEPLVDQVEGEYRRIVENPTEEIEVLGVCLASSAFGSGFPTSSNHLTEPRHGDLMNSGWNLNNLPTLPGSLLSFESFNTCSILLPRVHVGMCFSSVGWRVEEHHLPLLCYLHLGAPKIWYGIPGRYIDKFEAAMKSFPNFSVEQKKLHQGMVSQPSMTILKREGVPVYRCIQKPGEFVLFLPGAYHSGFNCGFNITEEANFAPLDWLPHGFNAVELYSVEGRKTSISYDKMLFGAANEAVKAQWELSLCRRETKDNLRWKAACGKNGILAQTFKSRIKSEGFKREYLTIVSQMQEINESFNAKSKRECGICLYDLYSSAAGCLCSADRYSCLNHAKQLCSCAWTDKFFLVRYEMSDLNLLLEALEGKLSAVYKWAREILGMAVYSYVNKNSLPQSQHADSPQTPKEHRSKDAESPFTVNTSITRIKAEIKARLLQSKISNFSSENKKVVESQNMVKENGLFTTTNSSVPVERTGAIYQPTSSNKLKREENMSTPAVVLNERADGLIFSLTLESAEILSGSSVSSFSDSDDCWSDSSL